MRVVDPRRLADELEIDPRVLRAWLRRQYPRETPGAPWLLTADQIHAARARWDATAPQRQTAQTHASRAKPNTRDEAYVVDLLEELIGEPVSRQHTFDWLVGDPDAGGRRRRLPVDAYWPRLGLVVEYRERQHHEPVPHFDKPDRRTVSGVHRGQQRQIYDRRRDELIPAHGLTLLVVRPAELASDNRGRLKGDRETDRRVLHSRLTSIGVL